MDSEPEEASMTLAEMGFRPVTVELPSASRDILTTALEDMIFGHKFTDLDINICGVEFKCHLLVLRCYSKYFDSFESGLKEMHLFPENVSAKAFAIVYDWMLAERLEIKRDGIIELFKAAKYFDIEKLQEQCWYFFADEAKSTEENAFDLYIEAKSQKCSIIESIMLPRISKYFLIMVMSDEYLRMEFEEVRTLLSSSAISVNTESEVLMCAVRWLDYDWENRSKYLTDIAKCTRFSFLTPWELIDLNNPTDGKFDTVVLQKAVLDPGITSAVVKALSYIPAEMFADHTDPTQNEMLKLLNQEEPHPRQWIADPLKKEFACRDMHTAYKNFCGYLDMLKVMGEDYYKTFKNIPVPLNLQFLPGAAIAVDSGPLCSLSLSDCSS